MSKTSGTFKEGILINKIVLYAVVFEIATNLENCWQFCNTGCDCCTQIESR